MRTVIVLAVLVAILHFGLRFYVTPQLGEDVQARFIERSKFIPSIQAQHLPGNDGSLTASNLSLWLTTPANDYHRRSYVAPIVIPFDLLFLVSLGTLLGYASVLLANHVGPVSHINPALWWVFPIAYIASDFVEDLLIIMLLTWPNLLSIISFRVLTTATVVKLITVTVAFAQGGLLFLGWLVSTAAPFSK